MTPTEFSIAGYRVRDDGSYNWVVEKQVLRKRKDGELYEDMELVGYYGELQNAVKRLYREELKGKGQQNMKGMADLILQMEAKLEEAVRDLIASRGVAA